MEPSITNNNLKSTSPIYVLTPSGFETIQNISKNSLPVYEINRDGSCDLVNVYKWKSVSSDTYKVYNRDSNCICYCSSVGTMYMCSDPDLDGDLFPLNPSNLNDSYKPRMFTRFNVPNSNTTVSDRTINEIVRTRKLNSECVESSLSTIYQILEKWKSSHGRYSVTNYNQALMMQSLLARIGYPSNIVNQYGLTVVVTSTTKTLEITDVEKTNEVNFTQIPVDRDDRQLHLIYSCNGNSFVM